jgi:hypothetical protein
MTKQIPYIDPTGTYDLDSKTTKKGNDTYGYFGQIQIKALSTSKIVMTFFVCKGAPSYNSGSFVDTLDYQDNKAIYTDPELDKSCAITFDFNEKNVTVKEKTDNYNFGCGFGHAVVADGIFKKTSSKVPLLKDPGTGQELK